MTSKVNDGPLRGYRTQFMSDVHEWAIAVIVSRFTTQNENVSQQLSSWICASDLEHSRVGALEGRLRTGDMHRARWVRVVPRNSRLAPNLRR